MTQWPTPEGIWLIKNQLQVLFGGVCSVSVSGIQHMEETNSFHQRQPGALLARGRLQPLEFSPGEEAAPQQPCLCRSLGLTGSSSSLPKASRECLLVPGNALPQQLGTGSRQEQEHISLQGGHPHFLGQLEALGNPTHFH